MELTSPNQITGPNAGGPRPFQFGRHWPPASVSSNVRLLCFMKVFLWLSTSALAVVYPGMLGRGPPGRSIVVVESENAGRGPS